MARQTQIEIHKLSFKDPIIDHYLIAYEAKHSN